MQQARNLLLPEINIPTPQFTVLDFATQAKKLQVKITKNGQPLVAVTLPSEAVLDLETLIPSEIHLELLQTGMVDLPILLQRLKEEGLSPQVLFSCELEEKQYRVWLE